MKLCRKAIVAGLWRLTEVPFATTIGLIGINGAVTFFTSPSRSPVHELVSPLDYLWAAIYGIGGLMIVAGIAFNRVDVEAAGCIAFAGGAIIQAIAFALVLGWGGWNTVVTIGVFAGAAMIRSWHIIHGRVLVLVETNRGILTVANKNRLKL